MPDILIPGVDGRLEVRFRSQEDENAPVALLLHPNPAQGGTMNNKVLYHASKAYEQCGFSTVRFNFRGVGRSGGVFSGDDGELSDAAAVLDWIQNQFPASTKTWVSGYSFGAWVAMQLLMRRPEIASYIILAPPAKTYDFMFLAPCPASGKIIYAQNDAIAPPEYVKALITQIESQKVVTVTSECIDDTDHFFTNKLEALRHSITSYVSTHMDNSTVI